MADASTIIPRHDQQCGSGGHSLRPIDRVLQSHGKTFQRDMVLISSTEHLLTAEQQIKPRLDPDRLSEMLSALARKHQVPGAQLAIHHGGETVALEVGELQYGTGHQVTRDAAFPIGSITKTFTATVAMILVADGDVELDAPLGQYVPELDDLGNEVTLRQLLSHTAGLPSGLDSKDARTASIRRHVLEHCCRRNLVLPPGTGFSYSNIGYVLVGHLIESITGMSWWDAMESILLRPLGIEPAFITGPDHRPIGRPLATGHSVNAAVGRIRSVKPSLEPAAAPAGGLAASAVDLVTLGLAQLGGTPALLPAVYAEQMRQAVPSAEPFAPADGWALGLAVFGNGSNMCVGHFGVLDGTDCNFRIDPFSGCVVAFTSNANTGGMWYELVDELCRAGLPIRNCSNNESLGRPMPPPLGCVGSYLNGNTELLVEATGAGALTITTAGGDTYELILFEDLSFFAREQPLLRGRFLRDSITGNLDRIAVNLLVARREPGAGDNTRCLMRAATVVPA